MDSNRRILNNPIIKSFLENERNYKLVQEAITNLTKENQEKVDRAFKEHYNKAKLIKYVSKLIHFFSIDYDKRINTFSKRFLLSLDQSLPTDTETKTLAKDLIVSKNHLSFDTTFGSTLAEQIENEDLLLALEILTPKQLRIIELIYLNNLPIKVVAAFFDTSPQNISNQHRKALKKLHDQLV